jgi:hypothetical protein
MAIKNMEVMVQIEKMLQNIKDESPQQYKIIKSLLTEVFLEYNSGRPRNVERKLVDMIDAEVSFKLQKNSK